MVLSQKALAIEASITLAIDAKAKQMKQQGENVVGFGAGEPDFDTPQYIKDAAVEALNQGKTKYTPAAGIIELREAICEKLKNQNGLKYTPAQIVVSNGAKHSLANVFSALLNPGDEVIIPSPHWVSYPELVKLSGGKPVFVKGREADNFKPSIEALEAACTPNTRAIVVNSPGNPCGNILTRKELEQIAEMAVRRDMYIISDEIYEELVYDGNEQLSIAALGKDVYERTVTINGFSKAYAMTGWRLGYTASPIEIAKVMGNLQSHQTSNPNSIAQYAAIAALKGPRESIEAMREEFDARRKMLFELINAIDGLSVKLPAGAFYGMINISKLFGKRLGDMLISDSLSFSDALLESQKVSVVPGIAFGADEYVRMSYATSRENIQTGVLRMAQFVRSLQ